jgi:hypothetical protein
MGPAMRREARIVRRAPLAPFAPVAIAVCALVGVLFACAPARAVETRDDVESDHVNAADDGGPRAWGFLVNPLSMGLGWLGAEIDGAVAAPLLVTAEGDVRAYGIQGYGAEFGLLFFPQGFAFHGLYVHPTVSWAHEGRGTGDGAVAFSATGIGGGIRVGYEWTTLAGATFRLGAGATYAKENVSGAGMTYALGGVNPQVDALVGWVF